MKTAHLFAGVGGGLLGDLILGHEPVLAVEWNTYACQVLRERASDGWFPGLHVHEGDIRLFDPSDWSGRVDSIHAGFPCQDISVAGAGAGIEGERSGLWREVVRITGILRPRELFLENSPAITARGLGTVLGDLAGLGYDARWCVLGAAAVGAPHLRARWWCLARRTDSSGRGRQEGRAEQSGRQRGLEASGFCGDLPDADRQQLRLLPGRKRGQEWSEEQAELGDDGEKASLADAVMLRGVRRVATTREWEVEPNVGRVAHGVASRIQRLEALGNGQVPLQAAAAYVILSS